MFMGEDGPQITILAGCDRMTKAFIANVVSCRGATSLGYAERTLATRVLSIGQQKATV